MTDLNMESGEYAVTQLNDISINSSPFTNDLVLTNRHLIVVSKSYLLGRPRSTQKYRLDKITVINGQAVLKIEKRDGFKEFHIQLKTGEKLVIISSRGEDFAYFASQINMLLTGMATIPNETSRTAADEVAEAFQNAFAVFDPRTYFGRRKPNSNQQQQQAVQTPRQTSSQCIGCHAPIAGYTGQVVTCGYCDTEQRL